MYPRRNISDESSDLAENHPMFLRQLSSSGASFVRRGRPPLCRAAFRGSSGASSFSHLPHSPAPHTWWSGRGFPPWPSRPRRAAAAAAGRHASSGRPRSSSFTGSWRSFHASVGLMMEHPDREPPYKRRKSAEEKREGKDGSSRKQQQHHLDPSPRPNHRLKDGSRERGKDEASKSERSRERDAERSRNRQRNDESPHQHGAHKHSQPDRSWTQTHKTKPEQDKVPKHKPNPWFKERGGDERRGAAGNTKGPEEQLRDRGGDGGQARSTTFWQAAAANNEPPPPGTSPPRQPRQREGVKAVKTLHRHWETPACSTDIQPPGVGAAFDFSVMSYNILSQELLQDNAYLYRHCDPGVLLWTHRLPNLLTEIQRHDADILCLQEVQEDHYENQIKPALQAQGYQCEYKKRTGRKPDGCAVIFKSSRLSLVSSNPVEFFRPGDALLDRDNVGLVVLLRPDGASDPSAFICVANTHLLYNPRRGDIKLAQLAILLAEIGRLTRLPDGSTNPVVLCGDFNSTPWSPLYSFLTTGSLDYRGLQIGTVSGQESSPRGQRLLPCPIWPHSLGIDQRCRYRKKNEESSADSPTAVAGAISDLTVEDPGNKAAAAFNRARIEHGLKLQSSYQHHLQPDGRREITTCHSRTALTVDYILYTPELATSPPPPAGRGLQLLGRLSLVGQAEMEDVNGLPNRHHSSDHLPLLARFRLRR